MKRTTENKDLITGGNISLMSTYIITGEVQKVYIVCFEQGEKRRVYLLIFV